jgi:hypothetical protein
MTFKVSTRLNDIYFEEPFDTELEALERAQSWTRAKLGGGGHLLRGEGVHPERIGDPLPFV